MPEEKTEGLEDFEKDLLNKAKAPGGSKKTVVILLLVVIALGGAFVGVKYFQSSKKPVEKVAVAPPPPPKKEALPPVEKAPPPPPPEVKEAPVVEAPPPSAEGKYTVQVGTYIYKSSMDAVSKDIREKGFTPSEKRGVSLIPAYQVDVGEFQDAEEVRNIVKKLVTNDIEVKFKIVSPGLYTLSAGVFHDKQKAEDFKNTLVEKGYPANVVEEKKKRKVYILRMGNFEDYKEAKDTRLKLADKGINSIVVKFPDAVKTN
jgi:cell division protein FtsN